MTHTIGRRGATGAALDAYEAALRTGDDLRVRHSDGGAHVPLGVARFLAAADPVDLAVLELCDGPVLDVGCGPGRMLAALTTRTTPGAQSMHSTSRHLGIDISAEAVRQCRARGAYALRRSVYDTLPREGGWGTVLLLDGNIGIGGNPRRLLRRASALLAPGGRVVVELAADPAADQSGKMVFVDVTDQEIGEPFGWASVGEHALLTLARGSGLEVTDTRTMRGRVFALLTKA